MTETMDGCSVLSEIKFVGTNLHVDTSQVLSVGVPFPLGEVPERGRSLTLNHCYGFHSQFSAKVIS